MAASYPGNTIGFDYKENINDTVIAEDVNVAYDEIKALGDTLGVNPQTRATAFNTTWTTSKTSWTTVGGNGTGDNISRLDYAENGINRANTLLVSNVGGSTITPSSTSVIGLVLKGVSSGTANLLEARPSASSTPVTYIDKDGYFFTPTIDGGGAHL